MCSGRFQAGFWFKSMFWGGIAERFCNGLIFGFGLNRGNGGNDWEVSFCFIAVLAGES